MEKLDRISTPARNIVLASTDSHYGQARILIETYQRLLGFNLQYQHFDTELATLPQMYGPPRGAMILAEVDSQFIGCVGLRNISNNIAEMKRMFVLPAFQGHGIGKALLARFIEVAVDLGYEAIRLDTIPRLEAALHLYRRAGFIDIAPYRHNPDPNAIFLELTIQR